jgi:ADP-L-glycero-D-manno-heptose 6-epimerase
LVRFIYASSAATYGDGSQGYRDDHAGILRLEPLNLYARSKQEFDLWALRRGLFGAIAGLKYFNVYGPNEYHKGEMRSMVLKGYEQIRDTGTISLFRSDHPGYPDGGQDRDFVYIRDAVDMTLFFWDHPEVNGLFNIGTGLPSTWNELAHALFAAMGKEPDIRYVDMPDRLRGKYQYHTCADMAKLRAAGYAKPSIPFRDAVREYVQDYLALDTCLKPDRGAPKRRT